jgi:hypothetical protein
MFIIARFHGLTAVFLKMLRGVTGIVTDVSNDLYGFIFKAKKSSSSGSFSWTPQALKLLNAAHLMD